MKWIPCEEKKPNTPSFKYVTYIKINDFVDKHRYVEEAYYYNGMWRDTEDIPYGNHIKVLAWMDMPEYPEPYPGKVNICGW